VGQEDKERVLIVAPTHIEGEEITSEIRARLKQEGKLGDEQVFETFRPLGWTDAEKGDLERYDGTEVLQFHRNSGTFRAGQRIRVADFKRGDRLGKPSNFAVFTPRGLALAAGDNIRITANGKDKSGTHKLNNGSQYTVRGFTKEGDLALSNGWVVDKDFGYIDHGYVSTSHASQGKTVDRVLIAMGQESAPAINAEQFYVSVSRGRESAKVYSNMHRDHLHEAIQRKDGRKSATELIKPKRAKGRSFMSTIRKRLDQLREYASSSIRKQKERGTYER
jgi:hypothetical protein